MSMSVSHLHHINSYLLRQCSNGFRQRFAAPLGDQHRSLDAFSRHHPAMSIKSEDEEYDPLLPTWEREVYSEYQRRTTSRNVQSQATGTTLHQFDRALADE